MTTPKPSPRTYRITGIPAFTLALATVSPTPLARAADGITAWLQKNTTEVTQLAPLRTTLDGVRVVGLGEATHGTKEFFEIRHCLLEYLITDLGFNALAIEASYSAAQAVNEYVLHGAGELSAVLTGLGTVMWDVEEFSRTLAWLRTYNQSVPEARKVHFFGLDITNTKASRENLLAYLSRAAPDRVLATKAAFTQIAAGEALGWSLAHQRIDRPLLANIRNLREFFAAQKAALVRRTSAAAYEQALRHVSVISQWVSANVPEETPAGLPRKPGLNNFARSRYMAENLLDILGDDKLRKIAIMAHNFHLGLGYQDPDLGSVPNMGQHLRARIGKQYYVFGLEFDHGTYLARAFSPERKTLGDLVIGTAPPAPEGSLPWQLVRTGKHALILNLRGIAIPPHVERWLITPGVAHVISWGRAEPPVLYNKLSLKSSYDGLIFIKSTSPTTPTPNARHTVTKRAGH